MSDFDAPRHVVRDVVARALAEDIGPLGDLTAALVPRDATVAMVGVTVRATACSPAPPAPPRCSRSSTPRCTVKWLADDGDAVGRRDQLGERRPGRCAAVLTGERSALNFLCHLSGVATATRRFVARPRAPTARMWDTRKTIPGLRALEKAAVRAGGGVNHRGLAVRLRAGEGQPPRRPRHHRRGGAGAGAVAGTHRRGRVRPHRRRSRRRSPPAPAWCCSTT